MLQKMLVWVVSCALSATALAGEERVAYELLGWEWNSPSAPSTVFDSLRSDWTLAGIEPVEWTGARVDAADWTLAKVGAPAVSAATPDRDFALAAAMAPAPAEAAAAAAAAPLAPALVQRDRGYGPDAGNWELTLAGSGVNDDDFEDTIFSAQGSIGYYLSRFFVFSLRQDVFHADFKGQDSRTAAATRVALDVQFDLNFLQPFVGGNIGYVYGDLVEDTWIAAPEAGVKIFVKDDTFILLLAEFRFFFDEGDEIDEAFDDGQFVYTLGIGFTF